jgi:hypothetical protein
MLKRRLVGLAVLMAWLAAPGVRAFAALSDGHGAACQDHVCQCRRHCPPSQAAAPDCHGQKSAPPCQMSGRCNHDGPSAPAASRPEWLPSPAEGLHVFVVTVPVPDLASGGPAAGHGRIDPRPPRAIS